MEGRRKILLKIIYMKRQKYHTNEGRGVKFYFHKFLILYENKQYFDITS